MNSAPRPSTKRSVSLGFAGLALCLGCSSAPGSGGPSGTAGDGGAPSEDAGAGHGGANNGKAGSTASCEIGECLVANTCLAHCAGAVVYVGCCECVAPAVNRNECLSGY